MSTAAAVLLSFLLAQPASPATRPAPETVRVATWNVENWRDHFAGERLRGGERPDDELLAEVARTERFQNDEDNWEIAQVILDPAFAPDVLLFQEGPGQEDLQRFADEWLGGRYPTAVVFPGNSTRGQTVGVLVREGFEVVGVADDFHEMPDVGDVNPRGDRLFARGPAFALVRAPGGFEFWAGTTHQKSKGGNSVEVTRWRAAEAAATRGIVTGLRDRGPADVVLAGDMNDEVGLQEFEAEAGGDVMAALVGEDLVLATRDLAEQGAITYAGYWRPRYRSFIDHVVLTPAAAGRVRAVGVFDTPWARVASDHLPVYVDLATAADAE